MRIGTLLAGSAGLLTLALAGCAAPAQQMACPIPPAPTAEVMPKPPVSDTQLVWQPGHWDWTGATYVWTGGKWVQNPGGTSWMAGSWTLSPGGSCAWNPGHFV
jgi:hypothetical protein